MASEELAEIQAAIPHRPPFLYVDRVIDRRPNRADPHAIGSIVTEWDVPTDGDWVRGHYPGAPILPGVLISEFAFQSSAILLADRTPPVEASGPDGATPVPVLIGVERARFRRVVAPGETLRAEVTWIECLGTKHWLEAVVRASQETVLRMRFAVALTALPATGTREQDGTPQEV